MKKMGEWAKRVASVGLSLALLLGSTNLGLAAANVKDLNTVHAASAVSRESIHDGTILHAFAWNFNTIKENIPDIAAAGYTAVQTSPINECLSTEPGLTLFSDTGKWYYHYQPTDWVIGNYQLGTRDEFKAMCDEAEKYGIGIIVDIDPNHTTPVFDEISDGLLNAVGGKDNLYHINGADTSRAMNYSDRVSTTYDPMGGLPDVDTENEAFQKYFYEFLEDCVACGADGFRIDTAKHIALPDDGVPAEYAGQEDRNDFYPNMKEYMDENAKKDYSDLFVYGEVLQGDTARLAAYQDMLGGTTASDYGAALRTAISSGNVATKKLESYKISDDVKGDVTYTADSDKLVTWVESHDNYINDKSYNTVDDTDVILAWSIIAARKDGTPLFFSRPMGSSKDNPWGENVLGAAGSNIYKDPQVVAVNKFRTAMAGESENLVNPAGDNSVLMIERGTKGVVIVNASDAQFNLEEKTNLADGNYLDSVEGRDGLFIVSGGTITGKVPAQSVVVLDKQAEGDYSTLSFFNSREWDNVSAICDGVNYPCDNTGDGWWKVTIPQASFKITFTDGNETSNEFSITPETGKYVTGENGKIYSSKKEAEDDLGVITKSVYFFNTKEWKTVYAYAWYEDGKQVFGGWPGLAAKNEGGYWYRADVKMMTDKSFSIIFNNGNGTQTENMDMSDMSKNYIALSEEQPGGNLKVERFASKDEASEALGIYGDKTTVYFYNTRGWEKVGAYTWGAANLGEWPGKEAENIGNNWWKLTIDSAPGSDFNIIFNDFGGGSQTGNLLVDSISKVYFWGNNKYSSKAEAEQAAYDFEHQEGDTIEEKDGNTLVYFYDENAWSDVYVYAWGGNYNNCIGDWPGTKMTRLGGGWYAVNVPNEAIDNTDLHLIFNDGNGTQLPDNVMEGRSKLFFTSSTTDGFASKSDVEAYLGMEKPSEPEPTDPSEPVAKPVDEEPAVADGYTRLYTKVDSTNTDDVYMYAWLKKDDGTSAGDPFGAWPGKKMMHIGNGWHAVDIENKYLTGYVDAEVEDIVEDNADADAIVEDNAAGSEDVVTEELVTEELVTEEAVEKEAVETEAVETEETDVISVITNVIDVLTSAFKPMTASAKETVRIPVEIQYIVHNNNGQQNETPVVTTVRPSDEELGKAVAPAPAPSVTPSQPSGSGSTPSASPSQGTVAPKPAVTVAEPQVPLAGTVKSADATTKKTSKSTKKAVAEDKEVATEETSEDTTEDTVEDTSEDTSEAAGDKTVEESSSEDEAPVEIAEEEAPKAAENSTFPVAPVAVAVVVIVAAVSAGLFIKRKRF